MRLLRSDDGARYFLVPAGMAAKGERARARWEISPTVGRALEGVDLDAPGGDHAAVLARARDAAARIARAVAELEDVVAAGPGVGRAPESLADALAALQRLQADLAALRRVSPAPPNPYAGALGEVDPDAPRFLAEYARRDDVTERLKVAIRESLAARRKLEEER